jgi:hypothetical protein
MPNPLPTVESNSALNFGLLTTNVAFKLGVANFGSTGQGAPQAPTDARNLSICQTIVNDAIRMFIADAPANGWFWTKPVQQVDIWPPIGPDATGSTYVQIGTYNSTASTFILTLTTPNPLPSTISSYPVTYLPNFVKTMEQCNIWLGGTPSTGTLGWFVPPNSPLSTSSTVGTVATVYQYLSPYTVSIYVGSSSTLGALFASTQYSTATSTTHIPFSFANNGVYTLPADFGGEISGELTYIAQTNRGMILSWTDEAVIRQWQQNQNQQLGTPFWAAIRLQSQPDYQLVGFTPTRRRWELLTYRTTNEFLSLLFPYVLAFNNLVNSTDLPPSPISFDDAIQAACRAQAERYMTDRIDGPEFQYYLSRALPSALKINSRGANRSLGYNGSGIRTNFGMNISGWRDYFYQRPPVGILPPGAGSY